MTLKRLTQSIYVDAFICPEGLQLKANNIYIQNESDVSYRMATGRVWTGRPHPNPAPLDFYAGSLNGLCTAMGS